MFALSTRTGLSCTLQPLPIFLCPLMLQRGKDHLRKSLVTGWQDELGHVAFKHGIIIYRDRV